MGKSAHIRKGPVKLTLPNMNSYEFLKRIFIFIFLIRIDRIGIGKASASVKADLFVLV